MILIYSSLILLLVSVRVHCLSSFIQITDVFPLLTNDSDDSATLPHHLFFLFLVSHVIVLGPRLNIQLLAVRVDYQF